MKEKILVRRKYLLNTHDSERLGKYYAAKLLNQFGILVDKPELVQEKHVKLISEVYGVNIPDSFYRNPQDTRYFTCSELLIEQIVSYFSIENFTGVMSENKQDFERIEVFKKVLPDYEEGKEIVF
ncbi:MAG: hypothetical protein ACOCV8_02410, partial [Spirochaetota bacterium]